MFYSGRITPSVLHHQQLTVSSTTTGRYDLGQLPCLTTRSQPDHLHQHCRISCVYQYSQLKTAERDHFILSTQPGHSFGTTNCAFSTKAAKWRASSKTNTTNYIALTTTDMAVFTTSGNTTNFITETQL